MSNLEEIRKNRIKKLKKFNSYGLDPYPQETGRTHQTRDCLDDFKKLKSSRIMLAGRIMSLRGHGGMIFSDLKDGSGKIQLSFKRDKLGEKGFKFFKEVIDIGDFLEVKGILFKTKKGEKTLAVSNFKMLSKTLLPLPEKWHGLKDREDRYRKRYLDLIFNEEVKDKFEKRFKIVRTLRKFLEKEDFLEVETPILQPIYGGARAKPFKTHLNALDMDLYLRIAPELYLKRLLIGGFEKVYEIGKCFRNEGIDKHHNPDFTMLEFYWAYADYKDLMKLTEKMFQYILKEVFAGLKLEIKEEKINFKDPWQRIEFNELIQKETGINLEEINQEGIYKKAKELAVEVDKNQPKAEIADEIYKKHCREKIIKPSFIIHHPKGFQPLAKEFKQNPDKLANFQLVVAGVELVNAFSELNDPLEQRKRFEEQEKLFEKGLGEAQRIDEEFLTALEYGMPPAAGFGMGIDRLVALLTNSQSLREVILFPTMKRK